MIRALLKNKLVHHDSSNNYDGYRLTPLGYDYLALKVGGERPLVSLQAAPAVACFRI